MTPAPRPKRRTKPPLVDGAVVAKLHFSLTPEDADMIDALAREMAEPRMAPNRSAALRRVLREWRAMQLAK